MEWIFAHSASAAPCEESRGQDLPLSYPSVIFQPLRPHYLHPAHHDPRYSHGSLLVLVTLVRSIIAPDTISCDTPFRCRLGLI
uniref:Uncharacterized protein n=1 Tax=Oryza nivara TaxID=4536 RepID=A0A0E0HJG1_ORYNI